MADDVLLVFSTFASPEIAGPIAEQLVTEQFAACANILPGMQSIFCWAGELEKNSETLVLFKTTSQRFEAFRAKLKELHPYEVPEIIAVRVADGLPQYLDWVSESCSFRALHLPNEKKS
jgi:periplasmic divalent cation tolerance protein